MASKLVRSVRAAISDLQAGDPGAVFDRWGFALRREVIGSWVGLSDSAVRDLDRRLLDLRDRHRGQRCFIMGNGPSLNDTPLDLLAGEHVFGLNRCFLLFERIAWRPSYYVSVDQVGIRETAKMLGTIIGSLPQTTFFLPVEHRRARTFHTSPSNVVWIRRRWHDVAGGGAPPDLALSALPSLGVIGTYTVTVAALQLAAWLGFDPIYLIGCDASYTLPGGASKVQAGGATGTPIYRLDPGTPDTNHFDPRYHDAGAAFYVPHPDHHLASFELGRQFAERNGVEIMNATVGGQLEVFPRVAFASLFPRTDGT